MMIPTQQLQIVRLIRTALRLWDNVINILAGADKATRTAHDAQPFIPADHHLAQRLPFAAISTLSSRLTLLVLLPPLIAMRLAIALATRRQLPASGLATGSRRPGWHAISDWPR